MTTIQNEKLLRKWQNAIDIIANEMARILRSRCIFNETRDVVVPQKSTYMSSYFSWIADLYVARLSTGIRRVIDTWGSNGLQTLSLLNLLNNIKVNPNVLTRSLFCAGWPDDLVEANRTFNKFAEIGAEKLNIDWLDKDIAKIKNKTRQIRTFIDKWVVHHDLQRQQSNVPTFGNVDSALQLLDEIICKYHLLLNGSDLSGSCKPVGGNWKNIVRRVWIEKA